MNERDKSTGTTYGVVETGVLRVGGENVVDVLVSQMIA
jgi:hypothetical protein